MREKELRNPSASITKQKRRHVKCGEWWRRKAKQMSLLVSTPAVREAHICSLRRLVTATDGEHQEKGNVGGGGVDLKIDEEENERGIPMCLYLHSTISCVYTVQ